MNGIAIGYLNNSPLEAFTLPRIMQTTLRVTSIIMIGIPTTMKTRGNINTIYRSIDNWKFMAFFPFIFIHIDSSFLVSQQIRGPITPPKGKKKPAKAARWQSIAQFLSVSVKILFSSMTIQD
jgi:hypothetical protein